jgi:hypothetical protein
MAGSIEKRDHSPHHGDEGPWTKPGRNSLHQTGETMIPTVLLTVGSAITIGFGAWHLFVPAIWKWYSYIPNEARELIVAVRAINLFFSVSLIAFGTVLLIFLYRKPTSMFYLRTMAICLALLWSLRTVTQVIWPQGSISPALQYGLLTAFVLTFLMFTISSLLLKE